MATTTTGDEPYVPTSILDHTLRTAPLNVIYGTATFTALGSLAGAASGVARGQPAIPTAFKTSINTGVFSFTFFSIREYALIPILTHLSLHPSPLPSSSSSSNPTTSQLTTPNRHTVNFLPTSISGIVSGTIFSAFQRPELSPKGHARAGITLGLGCLVVQSLINEGDLLRIKMLQRSEERRRALASNANVTQNDSLDDDDLSPLPRTDSPPLESRPTLLSPLPPNAPSNAQHFSDPTSLTFSERSDLLISSSWTRMKNFLGNWSPVKKIEVGEYRERLEKQRDETRGELERIRKEREELEKILKG